VSFTRLAVALSLILVLDHNGADVLTEFLIHGAVAAVTIGELQNYILSLKYVLF